MTSGAAVTHLFAGIAVTDYAAARVWYEQLPGGPPDLEPTDGEAVWHLASTGSISIVEDPDRAGTGLITLAVDDLDDRLATLAARGVASDRIEEATPSPRRAVVGDPDGNRITFFESGRPAS